MKYDIILIQPGVKMYKRYDALFIAGALCPPLGLIYLGSYLKEKGYSVLILDGAFFNYSIPKLCNEVVKYKPRYVGIGATTLEYYYAQKIINEIKKKMPTCITIGGGVHFSYAPADCLQENPGLDYVIKGEGEIALLNLIENIESLKNSNNIRGVYSKYNDPFSHSEFSEVADMDQLPDLDWNLLHGNLEYYKIQLQSGYGRSMTLMTSRGCKGRCVFCSNQIFNKTVRAHSSDYVIRQMRNLIDNFNIQHIQFEDDNFFLLEERNQNLFKKMKQENLSVRWSCVARVDAINTDILKNAKEAGCVSVLYGIETANNHLLKKIGKKISIEQVNTAINKSKQLGILTKGFFIIGLPNETKETLKDTYQFIKKCQLDDISMFYFTPFPGSAVYPHVQKFGKFKENWSKMNRLNIVFVPIGLKVNSMRRQMIQCLMYFYFRKKVIGNYLQRNHSIKNFLYTVLAASGLLFFVFKESVNILKCKLTVSFEK
jgi:radical SAM superfamily enzyme YgiQ (UPF0313 family)